MQVQIFVKKKKKNANMCHTIVAVWTWTCNTEKIPIAILERRILLLAVIHIFWQEDGKKKQGEIKWEMIFCYIRKTRGTQWLR